MKIRRLLATVPMSALAAVKTEIDSFILELDARIATSTGRKFSLSRRVGALRVLASSPLTTLCVLR